MKDYEPGMSFGEETAEVYDDDLRGDEEATVAFLAQLAGEGPALELAIGTGRIALPLAARGVQVDGIDISPAMVAKLREKPGGDRLAVTMGDFSEVPVSGTYRLIYVVYNTLFNLLTQEDQVRCFENVAAHLTDDGSFVVEANSPSFFYRLRNDQHVDAESIEVDEVQLDVLRHDPVTQTIDESHVLLSRAGGVQLFPIVQRYSWPSELDLMARMAGLRLRERWDGWNRDPYTATGNVVSVFGRGADG
jgi:SAM-dependent methyltransferase